MSLQIKSLDFLCAGNVIDPAAGAVITLEGLDPDVRLLATDLAGALAAFPCTFRWQPSSAELSLDQAWLRLSETLSECACLLPQPARVIQQRQGSSLVWLPIDDQLAAEAAAQLTCHILRRLQAGAPADVEDDRLWSLLQSRFWNQTHAHLARAARQINVPFYRLHRNGREFLQLGQGSRLRLCRETLTDRTPVIALQGTDKELMHGLLCDRGVPLPAQIVVESLDQALVACERIGWPVVLKPVSGAKGHGVWVGITGPEQLRQAWQQGGEHKMQLVQQMLPGADHRLLVINGRLMAVAQRRPAMLISDGEHRLVEQIARLNAAPERGVAYERRMNRVPLDQRLLVLLQEQGWTLQSVPPTGTRVQLSRTANISQGGDAIDCSDSIHPDNRRLAEDIALLIGADALGLDFISQDLCVSWRQGGTWLLEANLTPGLRPHLVADPDSDLCQRIVREWVGEGPRAGRIPTALITGSVGKTTTSRMVAHLMRSQGTRVGLTSTTGMELDGHMIASGDLAGGRPALQLLQDIRVDALVAEMARGGILKSGVALEDVDVAAVLNILDNHIGADSIRSRQDIARVKGLAAKRAHSLVVLNADDLLVLAVARERDLNSVALVSQEPCSSVWHAHKNRGGLCASFDSDEHGCVRLFSQQQELLSVPISRIPYSDQGAISSVASNAAFSSLIAFGMGLQAQHIVEGLTTFGSESGHRHGRYEVIIAEPFRIVLAWADGPEAMSVLSRYAAHSIHEGYARRILHASAADNRADDFLLQMGQGAWGFDRAIFAAREDRRGRSPEQVPQLLADGARTLGPGGPVVSVVGYERVSVRALVQDLQPNDFCLVCTFHVNQMRAVLREALSLRGDLGPPHVEPAG
jgi:cyanophycin synthetase